MTYEEELQQTFLELIRGMSEKEEFTKQTTIKLCNVLQSMADQLNSIESLLIELEERLGAPWRHGL